MSPYENVIVSNSFDEIVFSNRNRAYGAYMLRKKQKSYLITAFTIAFLMIASSVITPLIFNHYKGNAPKLEGPGPVIMDMDSTLDFKLPEPPKINLESMAPTLVPPIVVLEADSTQPVDFDPMADFIASSPNVAPPTNITPAIDEEQVIVVVERPFIKVEIDATFEGGNLNNFNKWVSQNIKYPQIAIETTITGKVYVQFVVNAKGKVENVTVLRGADPALDEEAVRVIKSSPKWSAPIQGGKAVSQLFTLPVIFKLEE